MEKEEKGERDRNHGINETVKSFLTLSSVALIINQQMHLHKISHKNT